ncbi:metal-binding protein ZinT [Desemzia sp. RIT804]|uniref:ZinT family metal-binding protein n=1 Tax=Desemzia sp. RIT 804 TaxID=2810209 RepID=UPI00194FDFB0|nr:metal-binding protein ZinT [Desemzia sp. RIT 804]MBM6615876.1 metal-binding protein ZinT [Desemzia sp. RIT 804]
MEKRITQYIVLLSTSILLGACGANVSSSQDEEVTDNVSEQTTQNSSTQEKQENEESTEIGINGLADHYHTGDTVELSASAENKIDSVQWQWYSKESEESEWEVVSGQKTQDFIGEALINGLEVKAALVDDNDKIYAESEPVKILIDDHHGHDEASKQIYEGYFEDEQVENRDLTDFEGEWQSVFPYLQSGDLDEVFEHKEEGGDMTAEEYKEYYTIGYETSVDQISIDGDQVTFYEDGKEYSGTYENDGYEILNYEKGNRGVRFVYKLIDGSDGSPKYIQFSDHNIFPEDSYHFHLYWGDDKDQLLEEMDNWPTYYPLDLDADGLVRDMLAH